MAGDQLAYVLPSMSLENFADRFQNHILISLDENKNVIWAAEQVVMSDDR